VNDAMRADTLLAGIVGKRLTYQRAHIGAVSRMPKKKPGMTPEQQSESFKAKARELIDAGELNPTDADRAMDRLVRTAAKLRK
jgi:hypothetical protein